MRLIIVNEGISVLDIPSVLIDGLTKGVLIGRSGTAHVYKVIYKGEENIWLLVLVLMAVSLEQILLVNGRN